jgi:Dolichyl-phosphate-mannose-protein mannosyltransferase
VTALAEVPSVERSLRPQMSRWRWAWWLPLAAILMVQAILTVRLVDHKPSGDEARYIYAGHQLIYEMLHGGGSPFYETYFSGNPYIYSPMAAIADHFGGIVAVRLMSTVFMLAVTAVLFATAQRLFGFKAAYASAALFAVIGLTHSLGVYANYDALTFLMLSLAAYCAVRASEPDAGFRWLLLVPLLLLLANLSKYMSILFDPIVIVLALGSMRGWKLISKRIAILGVATLAVLVLAFGLAGGSFVHGLVYTTLARPTGANVVLGANYLTPGELIAEAWHWVGPAVALATIAVLTALLRRENPTRTFALVLLLTAGLLVTLEAIHLHSDESMRQHEDFGAWFCCLAAGYLLSLTPRKLPGRILGSVTAVCLVGVIAASGIYYATHETIIDTFPTDQPLAKTLALASLIRPYLAMPGASYLISGSFAQLPYMDHQNIPWWRLSDDNYFKYPIPFRGGNAHGTVPGKVCVKFAPGCMYLEGPAAYKRAIRAHWFALISLYDRASGLAQDRAIEWAVERTRGYVLLTTVGGGPTWVYAPDFRHAASAVKGA